MKDVVLRYLTKLEDMFQLQYKMFSVDEFLKENRTEFISNITVNISYDDYHNYMLDFIAGNKKKRYIIYSEEDLRFISLYGGYRYNETDECFEIYIGKYSLMELLDIQKMNMEAKTNLLSEWQYKDINGDVYRYLFDIVIASNIQTYFAQKYIYQVLDIALNNGIVPERVTISCENTTECDEIQAVVMDYRFEPNRGFSIEYDILGCKSDKYLDTKHNAQYKIEDRRWIHIMFNRKAYNITSDTIRSVVTETIKF